MDLSELELDLRARGFELLPAADMRRLLEQYGSLADFDRFAASWNDLALDTYMKDGGRYRKRRHATFTVDRNGAITRNPHRPHYQTVDYNPLHGGIERWFEPILPEIGSSATMQTILAFCTKLFGDLARLRDDAPARQACPDWLVEAHQFRIEARVQEEGQPTPEGRHKDGVDYVLVLLVRRENIISGTTTIHGDDDRLLGSFTLAEPFDAALVQDTLVYHGVTPVAPLDPAAPAYRDVLVVTYKRTGA